MLFLKVYTETATLQARSQYPLTTALLLTDKHLLLHHNCSTYLQLTVVDVIIYTLNTMYMLRSKSVKNSGEHIQQYLVFFLKVYTKTAELQPRSQCPLTTALLSTDKHLLLPNCSTDLQLVNFFYVL